MSWLHPLSTKQLVFAVAKLNMYFCITQIDNDHDMEIWKCTQDDGCSSDQKPRITHHFPAKISIFWNNMTIYTIPSKGLSWKSCDVTSDYHVILYLPLVSLLQDHSQHWSINIKASLPYRLLTVFSYFIIIANNVMLAHTMQLLYYVSQQYL